MSHGRQPKRIVIAINRHACGLIALAGILGACGPSQAELDQTATTIAESAHATQTAKAPTSTPIPTLTPTPSATPTHTPTPQPTATHTAIPSPTPFLAMEDVGIFAYGVPLYLEVPADWEGQIDPQAAYTRAILSGGSAAVEVYIAQLQDGRTLLEYVEDDIDAQANQVPEFDLIIRERITNAQGVDLEIMTANQNPGTAVTSRRMYFLHDSGIVFVITYFVFTDEFSDFESLIEYSFNTFRTGNE